MQLGLNNISLTDLDKVLPKLTETEKRKLDAELSLFEKLKERE